MFTIPIMRTHNHPLQLEWYFLPILPYVEDVYQYLRALDKEINIKILH